MILEVKIIFSSIACILSAIVMMFVLVESLFLAFLLIMVIGFIFIGDLIIGFFITKNHLTPLLDPMKASEEICILFDFGGNVDFIKTIKGPLGKREFVKYKKEASIINDGSYQIHTINGNHGFVGHESYERNVSLKKAQALDKLEGDDIKEIYDNLPKKKIGDEVNGRVSG